MDVDATVSVKLCTAFGKTQLEAVKVMGNVPGTVGVPERTPPEKVTPFGSAPASVMAGVGYPEALGVKVPNESTLKLAVVPEVIVGGASTIRLALAISDPSVPVTL
jgi:hypothetical protein